MAKIISFRQSQKTQEDKELELLYQQNESKNYTNDDDNCCFKCGKVLDLNNDFIWFINQQAGYGSELDGSWVNIIFCDDCLRDFLDKT